MLVFLAFIFFFNDPATTEIYTLSLHDALPISDPAAVEDHVQHLAVVRDHVERNFRGLEERGQVGRDVVPGLREGHRSEEHTSELQSRLHLVCRLLLEKKKKKKNKT